MPRQPGIGSEGMIVRRTTGNRTEAPKKRAGGVSIKEANLHRGSKQAYNVMPYWQAPYYRFVSFCQFDVRK